MLIDQPSGDLNKEELERIDTLLSAARGFHYAAFIISGFSLALSSLEKVESVKLPVDFVVNDPLIGGER